MCFLRARPSLTCFCYTWDMGQCCVARGASNPNVESRALGKALSSTNQLCPFPSSRWLPSYTKESGGTAAQRWPWYCSHLLGLPKAGSTAKAFIGVRSSQVRHGGCFLPHPFFRCPNGGRDWLWLRHRARADGGSSHPSPHRHATCPRSAHDRALEGQGGSPKVVIQN